LKSHDRVLDVACGTGIVARIVADWDSFAGQITGLDLDPDMLAVARANSRSSGVHIRWQEGDALDLPFDEDTFDLVLCQQGLQYFPDKMAALREMRRVLVPGGRVAILVAASITAKDQPRKWVEMEALRRYAGEAEAEKERHPGYFQGGASLLRAMISNAGFLDVAVKELLESWGPTGTVAELIPESNYAGLEPEIRSAVVREIREAMRAYDKGSETRLPIGLYIAVGNKGTSE
jgi:ubiquinone/menaquinone biosynthesis C-methylase UbiE